jgi:hypothetical protein
VRKLNSSDGSLRSKERGDSPKWPNMFVFPDSKVARGDAATRFHRGCLNHNQSRAAYSAATQVHQMPVAREAIVARILAHRRDGDAIAENNIANSQRREQVRLIG